ncbi:Uncharacterised protein [BD1-7 clade bacterium]|uniref:Uncharacterized protein n=1 Tax=BD1-7 clade bacterium TaxID=2029982 RepID=A0A5S9R0U0_9GAMM|nr:Uncharacterised protein [BD1-7 clade bacterium]
MKKLALAVAVATAAAGCSDNDNDRGGNRGTQNQAPVVTDLVIHDVNGESVKVADVLRAQYTYSDVDNDAEGDTRFQWLVDGVAVTGATDKEYTVQSSDIGKPITLMITPVAQAGVREGAAETTAAVTVSIDGAPKAENVQVADNTAGVVKAGTLLTGSYDYVDAEDDAEGASAFRWLRDGQPIADATEKNYTVTAADEGKDLIFEVTPVAQGGVLQGAAYQSVVIEVQANEAPVASAVSITGDNGGNTRKGTTLTGTYTYSDSESDAEGASTFRWLRGGEAIADATAVTYTITAEDEGKNIVFEVTPVANAGALAGAPAVSTNTISVPANGAPMAVGVSVSNNTDDVIKVGTVLTGSYTFKDDENDDEDLSVDGTQLRWLRNGVEIANATGNEYTVTAADEDKALTFAVTPKAKSGVVQGLRSVSDVIDVALNEAPIAADVSITDVNGGEAIIGDFLQGDYNYTDVENDEENESATRFRWLRNGMTIEGETQKTYTLMPDDEGKKIQFEVVPVAKSGALEGQAKTSSELTVSVDSNTAPSFSSLSFDNVDATIGQTLTILFSYNDADGDAEGDHTFQWFRNGTQINGVAGATYDVADADKGAIITAKATAVAATGVTQGARQDVAGNVTIADSAANTAPRATELSITTSTGRPPKTGDTLTLNYTFVDGEGDTESGSLIKWYVNDDAILGANQATLTVGANHLGKTIKAVVIPRASSGVNSETPYETEIPVPADAAPVVTGVTVNDDNGGGAEVGDVLSVDYTYGDPDGHVEAGTIISWYHERVLITSGTSKTYTIKAEDKGKTIFAAVHPRANGLYGFLVFSTEGVSVPANNAPTFTSLTFDKAIAKVGDTIRINYTYQDADNDAAGNHVFRWYRGGTQIAGATGNVYTVTEDDAGENLTAKATAVAAAGELQGVEQLVANGLAFNIPSLPTNAAPLASDVKLQWHSSTQLAPGTYITGSYAYSDDENDAESGSTYRWLVDGTAISNATFKGYTIKEEDRGKNLTFEVTPRAATGAATGVAVTSRPVTVLTNRAPTATNVVVTDGNGGTVNPGDTLTVSYDYNDEEGDLEGDTNIAWQYRKGGSSGYIPNASGSSTYVVSSAYTDGEVWALVTPKAQSGVLNGEVAQSNTLNVVAKPKQAPALNNIKIVDQNDGDVNVGDVLGVTYDFIDADGDLEDGTTFVWKRNGLPIEGQLASTYTVNATDAGQRVSVTVTPGSDAGETGGAYTAGFVTVEDAPVPALTFEMDGDVKALVGVDFANPATAAGSGTVTYTISDETVAFVSNGQYPAHPAGKVIPFAEGTATITATIAASGQSPEISESYDIEVKPASFGVKAWVGDNGSTFTFANNLSGMLLHSTTDELCDWSDPAGCLNYQSTTLQDYVSAPTDVDDAALTTGRAGYYRIDYGNYQARAQLRANTYSPTKGAAVVEFKGKLWRLGGDGVNGGNSEIWSSVDGRAWKQEVTDASQLFSKRYDHNVIEFQGRLWLTGGSNIDLVSGRLEHKQDIWSSTDGIHWVQNTTFADFNRYSGHSVVKANGRLWLSGGPTPTMQGALWSSDNGFDWAKASLVAMNVCASTTSRIELGVVRGGDAADKLLCHSNGVIYELAGNAWSEVARTSSNLTGIRTGDASRFVTTDSTMLLIDPAQGLVYLRLEDGSWSQYDAGTDPRAFIATGEANVVAFNGKAWVHAAQDAHIRALSSSDGFYWSTDVNNFPPRFNAAVNSDNGKLIMAGGITGTYATDVWQSDDGISWNELKTSNEIAAQNTLSATRLNDHWWISQSNGDVSRLNVVGDAATWEVMASVSSGDFANMTFNRLVKHNKKLFLIAGTLGAENRVYVSDIYGMNWTDIGELQGTPFASAQAFSAFSFKGSLWVVAGLDSVGSSNKIWQSTDDGLTWTETVAPFDARYFPHITVFNDALWMVGGSKSGGGYNDVWRSTNGTDWTRVVEDAGFPVRVNASLVVHDGRMMLVGGLDGNGKRLSDVLSSTDGISWQKAVTSTIEFDPEPVMPVLD